jgi:hypothetical protein
MLMRMQMVICQLSSATWTRSRSWQVTQQQQRQQECQQYHSLCLEAASGLRLTASGRESSSSSSSSRQQQARPFQAVRASEVQQQELQQGAY